MRVTSHRDQCQWGCCPDTPSYQMDPSPFGGRQADWGPWKASSASGNQILSGLSAITQSLAKALLSSCFDLALCCLGRALTSGDP